MVTSINCLSTQGALFGVGQYVFKDTQLAKAVPTAKCHRFYKLRETDTTLNLPIKQIIHRSFDSIFYHLLGILSWLEHQIILGCRFFHRTINRLISVVCDHLTSFRWLGWPKTKQWALKFFRLGSEFKAFEFTLKLHFHALIIQLFIHDLALSFSIQIRFRPGLHKGMHDKTLFLLLVILFWKLFLQLFACDLDEERMLILVMSKVLIGKRGFRAH